jgi:hypothetical protein
MYKRPLFFYLIIIFVVLFSQNSVKVAASNTPDLYISEVWHNYVAFDDECRWLGNPSKKSNCSWDAWVEVTNPTNSIKNLSNYSVIAGGKNRNFENITLAPYSSIIVQNKYGQASKPLGLKGILDRSVSVSSPVTYVDILQTGNKSSSYKFVILNNSGLVVDSFDQTLNNPNSSVQFCIDTKSGNKIQVESKSTINVEGKTIYATPGNQNDCPKPAGITPPTTLANGTSNPPTPDFISLQTAVTNNTAAVPKQIQTKDSTTTVATSPAISASNEASGSVIQNPSESTNGGLINTISTLSANQGEDNSKIGTTANYNTTTGVEESNKATTTVVEEVKPSISTVVESPVNTLEDFKNISDMTAGSASKDGSGSTNQAVTKSDNDNPPGTGGGGNSGTNGFSGGESSLTNFVTLDSEKTDAVTNQKQLINIAKDFEQSNSLGDSGSRTNSVADNNDNAPPGSGGNGGGNSSSGGSGSDNITHTSNGSTNGFILIQSENKIETRSVNEVKLVELAVKESNSNPQILVATVSDDNSNPPGSLTHTVEQKTKSKTLENYLANNVIEVELQSVNNSSDFAFVQQSVVINPQITPSVVNQSQSFVISKSDSSSKVTLDMHSVKSGFIYFDLVLIIFLLTKTFRHNSIFILSIIKSAKSSIFQKR